MQVTIQTKITDKTTIANIEKMCDKIAHLRGMLLKELLEKKKNSNELKKEYIAVHGLTARQYNSLAIEVKGLIASGEELRKLNIKETKSRIASQKKKIKKLLKTLRELGKTEKIRAEKTEEKKKISQQIHQKNRKLEKTEERLRKLEKKKTSICLGGKKLFLAQYHLAENNYKNHEEWLSAWRKKRKNRMFFLGSKDEKFGNQNCQLLGKRLQVRVLPGLEDELGKYIFVPLEFSYGEDVIHHALSTSQAINYRFVHKNNQWYLFLTTKRKEVETITKKELGAIGVDVNKAHLAWGEINRHGNLVNFGKISTSIQDRSSNQINATFGDAIKKIVAHAKNKQKPIVIEDLDFTYKKTQFAQYGKRYRRMLSNFAYSKFQTMLCSKAFREGVHVIKVNPAFSSIIGRYKFADMYGISIHIAASLVLARRGLRFTEFLPTRTARYLAAHRYWHVWKQWRKLSAVLNREKRVGPCPGLRSSPKKATSSEIPLSSYSCD